LVARLKSSTTVPSASGAATCSDRFAGYVVTPLVASVNRMCRLPGALPLKAVSASGCPSTSNSTTPGAAYTCCRPSTTEPTVVSRGVSNGR
jgi:hypothetical protein